VQFPFSFVVYASFKLFLYQKQTDEDISSFASSFLECNLCCLFRNTTVAWLMETATHLMNFTRLTSLYNATLRIMQRAGLKVCIPSRLYDLFWNFGFCTDITCLHCNSNNRYLCHSFCMCQCTM